MRTTQLIVAALGLGFLTGCDCMQRAEGVVVDAASGRPLAGVRVEKPHYPTDADTTDRTGVFEVQSFSGGLFGCPKMEVVCQRAGYEPLTRRVCCGDTVRLRPVAGR